MNFALNHIQPLVPSTPSICSVGGGMSGSLKDHVWSNHIDFEGMARFLRRLYPAKTALSVAADTGLPADSVKKWINGDVQPNGRAVFALIAAYGPEFISASLHHAPAWLDANVREAKTAALKSQIEQMQAELASIENR